jgi:hypothetical protein
LSIVDQSGRARKCRAPGHICPFGGFNAQA